MKSILMSIQPKWCELIASGKKTIEVRKTRPKLEAPFKVYIYCTKPKLKTIDVIKDGDNIFGEIYHGKTRFIKADDCSISDMWGKRQKVIGEFICGKITPIIFENGIYIPKGDQIGYACMTVAEAKKYGKGKTLYGYQISNLKMYDKPKELNEFYVVCKKFDLDKKEVSEVYCTDCGNEHGISPCEYFNQKWRIPLTRPPQSYCYVETLE